MSDMGEVRTRNPNPVQRVWYALLDADYLPIAFFLGLTGVGSIVTGGGFAPRTMADVLPRSLVIMWTVAIALGGILAVAGALSRKTRIESVGLAGLIYGSAFYAAVVVAVGGLGAVTASGGFLAILSTCLIRMRHLHKKRRIDKLLAARPIVGP